MARSSRKLPAPRSTLRRRAVSLSRAVLVSRSQTSAPSSAESMAPYRHQCGLPRKRRPSGHAGGFRRPGSTRRAPDVSRRGSRAVLRLSPEGRRPGSAIHRRPGAPSPDWPAGRLKSLEDPDRSMSKKSVSDAGDTSGKADRSWAVIHHQMMFGPTQSGGCSITRSRAMPLEKRTLGSRRNNPSSQPIRASWASTSAMSHSTSPL